MTKEKLTTADKILDFYKSLRPDWSLPDEFDILFPFSNAETWNCVEQFYHKYFDDYLPRKLVLGINPGRFGAGITGIPFTDPLILQEQCGIDNPFKKKNELSAIFIYELIDGYGGIEAFYSDFFISSVSPLGFLKEGVNCNYYDDKKLYKAIREEIIQSMWDQISIGIDRSAVYCLGKGMNYKFLQKLNKEFHFFEKIIPLPHPRWVMQYRRKFKNAIAADILHQLKRP